jgi:repressor LexA
VVQTGGLRQSKGGDMRDLTDRQREALRCIVESIEDRMMPPTLREIGNQMGIKSTNGVNDHLKALEKKGYIKRHKNTSRGNIPTTKGELEISFSE